ncbi:MAG: hypothetical protein CVV64_05595 [Candidatus Wallbacteria bacterium HGW-Wallbacteria-1]|jgi:M6 family metalloprotease-like protein|uniref:Peptidase M6-like domain-containing protein n=1 Tax=Candidatus Wallbacteria bacterium HGW-Wallbacteria-1 TaxID=2013854 RepID=A0A2N1PSC9_9BACT|nr:MAG: hypothetical protein CVV64_05595 [Candidatus Wallbacteria bacterium HGW-Wallbacteria-1]
MKSFNSKHLFVLMSLFLAAALLSFGNAAMALKLTAPENNATLTPEDKILFSWNAADDASAYELMIWDSSEKSVINSFSETTELKLDKSLAQGTYKWSIRPMKNLDEPSGDFSEKFTFSVGEATEPEEGEFKKTGKTIVVPIQFSDVTFASEGTTDYKASIKTKMDGMGEYYKTISWNAPDAMDELAYDIAPVYTSTETRAHYGKDIESDTPNRQGLNYKVDAGDFGSANAGPRALKKEALEYLRTKKVPYSKYSHIIYVVPGGGGNNAPNDQIWPHSVSIAPWTIINVPFTDYVVGGTASGILMGIDTSVAIYSHEFGHQFGLPDLYPYHPDRVDRNLGWAGLMASGANLGENGVGMTGLSKKRGYFSGSSKKDWLKKSKVEKVDSSGDFTVHSRDGEGTPTLILVAIKSTWDPDDYFAVEVFDRKKADRDFRATVDLKATPIAGLSDTNNASAGVLIYHTDDDDVDDIKYLQTMPADASSSKKHFLPGGFYEDLGVKVEVVSMKDEGNHWSADVKVTYDDSVKRPGGFGNTIKGVGIVIKNKFFDLFAPEASNGAE